MTRRDIIVQILAEASGRPLEGAGELFDAMVREEMIHNVDLDEVFSSGQAEEMLRNFRAELPGIRRWLCETGLLSDCGHA
ncbi:hypothetical protein [Geoalkalibacter halelectricus]|uniref:Uncharacterized protein n=1 Tax=Geoalkalibacter halelectricus TaxID=2847045 RepID=A0ABY5ZJ57_9BACT|nr:hypothetical protein [Geoalkalibacter halelectricus]MDO3379361.1 hypothetical protein [Geoalkalibacter halelectricus]UWZ78761.1 hypothetical protein L9S41_13885 [Geoalkalibacter halelectricus]